jgi:[protein-PII] uridylyltransferase
VTSAHPSPVDIVAAYLITRHELLSSALPGPAAARELSDLTDKAVSRMRAAALPRLRAPWAVLALGGWGAGRLLPGSDLDFLIVTDAPAGELKPALEAVLYPLWDSGLKIGHQVRSRRDHARVVRDDLDTLTATLTGRFLAGDETLGKRVLSEVAASAGKQAKRLLPELATRPRPGSPYLLEPDLKEGAGGQRDLDELAWTAAVLSAAPAGDHSALVGMGVIDAGEATRLDAAAHAITAARWALHRASSRPTSVLDVESAEDVRSDVRGIHASLADAHHLLLRVRARLAGRALEWDALTDAMTSEELFAMLDAGTESLPALEDAAWSGRLDDLLPGFGDLLMLRRPAIGHLYTVGAHSLRCATLARDASREAPSRALQAASLLHDAGKVQAGPGHQHRGAAIASMVLPRLGLPEAEARDAAILIREHLLLAEVSATEDIHDEDVLLRAASRIGEARLVGPLLALAEADSRATDPGAWTPWHAALQGELADRLAMALAEDVEGAGLAKRAETVRHEALALLGAQADPALTAFAEHAHLRYLAAQRPSEVAAHAHLVAAVTRSGAVPARTAVEGTWSVTVAAADRPGLFASIAGALALAGLDILSADAFAAPDSVALDVFVVRSDTLAEADVSTWAAFERYLAAALHDHLALDVRLAERRRRYAPRAEVEPTVSTERTGSYATALYVTAADRVGLLYDLARALGESDLDIRWAKATTRGPLVRDVFHVVDASGEPVDDPGVLGHLAMRIRERA